MMVLDTPKESQGLDSRPELLSETDTVPDTGIVLESSSNVIDEFPIEIRSPQLSFHRFFNEPLPKLTLLPGDGHMALTYIGHYGPHLISTGLDFLAEQVSGDFKSGFMAFLNHVKEHHMSPEQTSCKLAIRIYRVPDPTKPLRWHQDGFFWLPNGYAYQLGTVLLGPPTLFQQPTQETQRIYHEVTKDELDSVPHVRQALTDQFRDFKPVSAKPGELSRWTNGHDTGVVHSEPFPIVEPRIFVSLLPGTEAQLRNLCELWDMTFKVDETLEE